MTLARHARYDTGEGGTGARTMQQTIDCFELARAGGELRGAYPLGQLQRLASMLAGRDGALAWRLRGWREYAADGLARDFMVLSVVATVQMACVRCTGSVGVEIQVDRAYRLVRSEAEAERLDLADHEYDVLAGSRRFDLAGLIEDEVIMALPAMPRHECCELPGVEAAAAVEARDAAAICAAPPGRTRPFAVLERLGNDAQNTDMIED